VRFPFVKGHGTRNDFVLLPDLTGSVHGDLPAERVAAICDRRSGIGADGVIRVIRASADAPWFMDYRNADGSTAEMCGNGIRVFARYLADEGLVDPTRPVAVDTRDGMKTVTYCRDGEVSVDLGTPTVGGDVTVTVDGRALAAHRVDVGNPHAVAFVDDLAEVGPLREQPGYDRTDFPDGVNVELAVLTGDGAVAMRVFERGVGETQSCGTGACAVAAATAARTDAPLPVEYAVDVPGGRLTVRLDDARRVHLKGPAVLVAEGSWLAG
jgi:diaminopimelate epimerase